MTKMTPELAYFKALEAGKRLPELESIILTSSWFSYQYAADIIKGRWIEAEDIIMISVNYSGCYALFVIDGKLPEKMHNMMILYAIKDPNHLYVKSYFEYIE